MRAVILPLIFALLAWPGTGFTADMAPTQPAPEPAPLAVIHEAGGQVFIAKAGDPAPVPAEEDMELGPGDTVTTGANGSVIISLRDEHYVKLAGLASLTVKELRSDMVAGGIWARLMLAKGRLMASVAHLASPDSRFEVDTPTAVAAVKGTTFQVAAAAKSTAISVLEGSVAASGINDGSVAAEELEVKEGFETTVDGRTRRPGALTQLFKNEKRKKFRVSLSEFRAKMVRLRARGQSGELQHQRRLRVLARALLIRRYQQKNPQAYQSLPAWKRNRLDQFLAGHQPELDARRAEVTRFLNSNPKSRKRLEQQSGSRFAGAQKPAGRRSKKTPARRSR